MTASRLAVAALALGAGLVAAGVAWMFAPAGMVVLGFELAGFAWKVLDELDEGSGK